MLAGRGAVYTTYEAAVGSLNTSGIGRYHDHCRCVAAEGYYTQGSNPDNKYSYELPSVVQRLAEKWARIAEVAGESITAQEQLWKRITAAEFAGNDKDVWIERIGHDIPADNIPHEYVYTAKELRDFGLITGKPAEELPDAKRFIEILTGEKADYCRELGQMEGNELQGLQVFLKKRETATPELATSWRENYVLQSPDFFIGNGTLEVKTMTTFYKGDTQNLVKHYTRALSKDIKKGAKQSDSILINGRGGHIDRTIARDSLEASLKTAKYAKRVFFLGKDSNGYYKYIWG